jgi:hypothetical protein
MKSQYSQTLNLQFKLSAIDGTPALLLQKSLNLFIIIEKLELMLPFTGFQAIVASKATVLLII